MNVVVRIHALQGEIARKGNVSVLKSFMERIVLRIKLVFEDKIFFFFFDFQK